MLPSTEVGRRNRQAVHNTLADAHPDALTADDMAEYTGLSRDVARKHLKAIAKAGHASYVPGPKGRHHYYTIGRVR